MLPPMDQLAAAAEAADPGAQEAAQAAAGEVGGQERPWQVKCWAAVALDGFVPCLEGPRSAREAAEHGMMSAP